MFHVNLDVIVYIAMAVVIALLIARTLRNQNANIFEKLTPKLFRKSQLRKKELAILAFKKCPQCADQLPLSALVCDGCDYNFLAGSILRHKLLPAPEVSTDNETARRPLAQGA